jgi:hypothetical protein
VEREHAPNDGCYGNKDACPETYSQPERENRTDLSAFGCLTGDSTPEFRNLAHLSLRRNTFLDAGS